jgi:hypothetical protein
MRDNTAVICLMAAGKARAKRKALFVAGYRSGRKDSPLLYRHRSFHKNAKVETPCNIGSCASFRVAKYFAEHLNFHSKSINLTLRYLAYINLPTAVFCGAVSEEF